MTTVFVVGNGAREHALCWGLRRSGGLDVLLCAPGNPGTAELAETLPIQADDLDGILRAATERRADLVVVGPEAPLAAGLADRLRAAGIVTFGPSAAAARIEASKAWAKDVMRAAGVPAARSESATSRTAAMRLLGHFGLPVVLKADGLAAGKGVSVVHHRPEAERVLDELFVARALGGAADVVLVEEFLGGRELSVLALCDGARTAVMPAARDYKPAFDGDRGPNTGGMGAYTRPADATPELLDWVEQAVLVPTLRELGRRGCPFVGTLYAGLMLTLEGPRVLEFNCRFGDPETQVIVPLLESSLLDALRQTALGRLDPPALRWSRNAACGVVLASGGYPGAYATDFPIVGLPLGGPDDVPDGALVFQAGTALRPSDGAHVTAGGRVLTVVGRGPDLATARGRAYAAAGHIHFEGRHARRDIGTDDGST